MGSYFRGDFGQFFTPRPIVKFIIEALPIRNDSRVIDTSCGSGGFLLYALDKIRQEAIEYYKEDPAKLDRHWHDFARFNLFGIEINESIARTAKMNMIIHDDGHTNVISSDGLLNSDAIVKKTGNTGFKFNSFDFIVTNPPFGSSVKQNEKAYLHQFSFGLTEVDWLDTKNTVVKNRPTQSTEILFIEQCRNFLKPGGYLAIVIPDGILTNSSLQYVRDKIEVWYRIVAVVSMPQTAFMHTGAGVKSSVLFLRKHSDKKFNEIIDQMRSIQEKLKTEMRFSEHIESMETERNNIIKNLIGFKNTSSYNKVKDIVRTDAFKEWKAGIMSDYTRRINNLKDRLLEQYFVAKQKELEDYSIFMAIAEDIGYDATGRQTGNNELFGIGSELAKFIRHINTTEK